MDGTLIDSMQTWRGLIGEYILSLDLPVDSAYLDTLKDKNIDESIRAIHENFKVAQSVDDGFRFIDKLIRNHYQHNFDMKPGARQALEKLKKMGVKMMVATATPDEQAHIALKAQGIAHYFCAVQTCQNTGLSKSDPKYWEKALATIEADPDEVVIFEDALYCVKTVKAMGLYTVCIEDAVALKEAPVLISLADQYIRHYKDLNYDIFKE